MRFRLASVATAGVVFFGTGPSFATSIHDRVRPQLPENVLLRACEIKLNYGHQFNGVQSQYAGEIRDSYTGGSTPYHRPTRDYTSWVDQILREVERDPFIQHNFRLSRGMNGALGSQDPFHFGWLEGVREFLRATSSCLAGGIEVVDDEGSNGTVPPGTIRVLAYGFGQTGCGTLLGRSLGRLEIEKVKRGLIYIDLFRDRHCEDLRRRAVIGR